MANTTINGTTVLFCNELTNPEKIFIGVLNNLAAAIGLPLNAATIIFVLYYHKKLLECYVNWLILNIALGDFITILCSIFASTFTIYSKCEHNETKALSASSFFSISNDGNLVKFL